MAKIPVNLKQAVFERARDCCEYCRSQARFSTQAFSVEHIIPSSSDGKTVPENLALACQGCNYHKYTKTMGINPVDGELVSLYNPRQQRWAEHFTWNENFSLIIGLTPTGRATVESLKLNREGLVNLRRALYTIGEHPAEEIE
ncbi:MAG: HNH endonuclease [bacterium]|nr:HNH endonuclease [bacterium]